MSQKVYLGFLILEQKGGRKLVTDAEDTTGEALLGTGKPSEEGQEPSTPPVYTQEQVERLIRERHSKLDKRIAEQDKVIARLNSDKEEREAMQTRVAELEKVIEERDLDGIRGNPDALKLYQLQRTSKEKEKELLAKGREINRREAQLQADSEVIRQLIRRTTLERIAKETGVDIKTLDELGIEDTEKLEKVAKLLSKNKTKAPETETITPDSGIASGGMTEPSSPDEFDKWSVEKMKKYLEKKGVR